MHRSKHGLRARSSRLGRAAKTWLTHVDEPLWSEEPLWSKTVMVAMCTGYVAAVAVGLVGGWGPGVVIAVVISMAAGVYDWLRRRPRRRAL
jgi:hypothetical protein